MTRIAGNRVLLVLLLVTLSAWGCGGNNDTTLPTAPTTNITETFTGSLNQNGARTHPFSTATSGAVAVTLSAIAPEVTIGMALGTWNGTACSIALANDATLVSAVLTGSVSSAGNYCVRVYDVGNITEPVSYTLTLVHP